MHWEEIFSTSRVGQEKSKTEIRSGFQRDFDRLVFSSAFRRLQNKTQVFPLPGSTFVHNRLTHSLEVASVGRSLGKIAGEFVAKQPGLPAEAGEFYRYELSNVIAAACLAHDIGNPAFGHSGEKALSAYFTDQAATRIEDRALRDFFGPEEWADLVNFEGNANAFRTLTHTFRGKLAGGFGLTYTTLASILKYPCAATGVDGSAPHRKKYGYFLTETGTFGEVTEALHMIPDGPGAYRRHPFVYLTEAADDICYQVIDMEDAHRLGILSLADLENILLELMTQIGRSADRMDRVRNTLKGIGDPNEKIAYLRARCINTLTLQAGDVFMERSRSIVLGEFGDTLMGVIREAFPLIREIEALSVEKIYNHESVIQIEVAGYHVLSELLAAFVPALLKSNPAPRDKKLLRLVPEQFTGFTKGDAPYAKVRCLQDYISGMTDLYATELYRKLTGIDIPSHY